VVEPFPAVRFALTRFVVRLVARLTVRFVARFVVRFAVARFVARFVVRFAVARFVFVRFAVERLVVARFRLAVRRRGAGGPPLTSMRSAINSSCSARARASFSTAASQPSGGLRW
jgi:hypothetical protein